MILAIFYFNYFLNVKSWCPDSLLAVFKNITFRIMLKKIIEK